MKCNFLKTFLVCAIAANTATAQNLITNGEFSTGATHLCASAPTAWTSPTGIELTDVANSGNWWVDLSDCVYWDNDRGIEQTISTIPGHIYGVGFDMGVWNDVHKIKAGITVSAAGTTMTFKSDDFSGAPLAWHRYGMCFTAVDYKTTISFTCSPELSSSSPAGTIATNYNPPYNHNVTAVGLDNISVYPKGYNLVANSTFSQNGYAPGTTVNHMTPKSWTASTLYFASGDMQLSDQWQPNNFWVDLTDDKNTNKRWIEQKLPTGPNMMYRLTFKVGATKNIAGIDLLINGSKHGTFQQTPVAGGALSWTHYYVDFIASSTLTSIKFVCNSPIGIADVVGLDDVEMVMKCCFKEMIPEIGVVGDEPPCDCPPSDKKEKYSNSVNDVSDKTSGMIIYPNPAQTVLNISMQQGTETNAHYSIYDISGRELLSGDQRISPSSQISIPVQHLPAGTYMITVEGDFQPVKQKFTKE